jgi:hypothetical protein
MGIEESDTGLWGERSENAPLAPGILQGGISLSKSNLLVFPRLNCETFLKSIKILIYGRNVWNSKDKCYSECKHVLGI